MQKRKEKCAHIRHKWTNGCSADMKLRNSPNKFHQSGLIRHLLTFFYELNLSPRSIVLRIEIDGVNTNQCLKLLLLLTTNSVGNKNIHHTYSS